ncbi:MAG: signal peptidase II [Nocardiopsaceae bacterium]|jgi:signal peptidase II|nr:signal peptidase II [Nocardiopsaceae bacterium]
MQAARGTALTEPGAVAKPSRRRVVLLVAIAATVYLLDQVSKAVVVATLRPGRVVHLIDNVLQLQVLRNSGAAFSIGTSMTVVFSLIAVGVIVFIVRTSRRLGSAPWAVTLGLLLGGATGNLTDRLLRSPGTLRGDVVDWIQLPHWPVFNLADSAIVCGGVLAVLLATRGIRLDGSRDGHGGSGRPGGGTENRQRGGPAGHERDGTGNHQRDSVQNQRDAAESHQRDGKGSGRRAREGPG